MTPGYKPTDWSRLYRVLAPPFKTELDAKVDAEFFRRHPGSAPHRALDWNHAGDRPAARNWLRIRDEMLDAWSNKGLNADATVVRQPHGQNLCWAAALESWTMTSKGHTIRMEDLRKQFSTRKDGGIDLTNPENFRPIANRVGMDFMAKPGSALTYQFLFDLLRKRKYVMIMYTLAGISHTVVASAITLSDDGSAKLRIMDPLQNVVQFIDMGNYTSRSMVLIGWEK
jgi:hypothetical protein